MATVEFTLVHGLKIGETVHKRIVVRELDTGVIIDAQTESERLVESLAGPILIASPSLVGIHTLRRQIAKIGDIDGPLDLKDMRKLHPLDLDKIQAEAQKLESAMFAEMASQEVARTGRTDNVPASD